MLRSIKAISSSAVQKCVGFVAGLACVLTGDLAGVGSRRVALALRGGLSRDIGARPLAACAVGRLIAGRVIPRPRVCAEEMPPT
jgi:hypothetical protein